jgi:hypothetical protein
MPSSPASLRFPSSRALLPRTRLAYVHLRNLLSDAKRDRSARISGYVAIALFEELVILYLVGGEVANATVRDNKGARAIEIAKALEKVPHEPEYGEISFHEADAELLACMFASQSMPSDPFPDELVPHDPTSLFPFLMSTVFDGILEIVANDSVNYLVFRNGTVARVFLASSHHGTVVDRVAKLFAREGRVGELRVCRWAPPDPLPVQAPPALVQAYRELAASLVDRLVRNGRESAPAIAEHARANLAAEHPALDAFTFCDQPTREVIVDARRLSGDVAAWIRDMVWTAVDHDSVSPEELIRELTWDRRHMFQSAGLFDELPWKVM